jgi:ribosomal protein L20
MLRRLSQNEELERDVISDLIADTNVIEDLRLEKRQVSVIEKQDKKMESLKSLYVAALNQCFQKEEMTYDKYMNSLKGSIWLYEKNRDDMRSLLHTYEPRAGKKVYKNMKEIYIELSEQNQSILVSLAKVVRELQDLAYRTGSINEKLEDLENLAQQTKLYRK